MYLVPIPLLARRYSPIPCLCSFTRPTHHPDADNEVAGHTTPWQMMASEFPTPYHDIYDVHSSVSNVQAFDPNHDILICLISCRYLTRIPGKISMDGEKGT